MATFAELEEEKKRRGASNPTGFPTSLYPNNADARGTGGLLSPRNTSFPNNLQPNNAAMGMSGGLFAAPAPAPAPARRFATPEEAANLKGRRELFADMQATARGDADSKSQSGFRERAKALGIDDAGYARGIGRAEGTLPMPASTPPLGGLRQEYDKFKNRDNRLMESTSSLRDSVGKLGESRSLGTQSGAMRREALRLRKQGYSRAAEQMALGASEQRLSEPTIMTQEQRRRLGEQSRQADAAGADAAALQSEYTQLMRDAIKKRRGELDQETKPANTVNGYTLLSGNK